MAGYDAWQDAEICRCGKKGWLERADAARAYRIMRGWARRKDKSPWVDQLNVYECRNTAGMFHVGHGRRPSELR